MASSDPSTAEFQAFLDSSQYTEQGVLRYEKIFGRTFISTGGLDTTKELIDKLGLAKGAKVLDVGCGVGGSMFYLAENYGAHVLGLDLSANMITIGRKRQESDYKGAAELIEFEEADVTQRAFPDNHFDLVYSRDTILHIADKEKLYARLLACLKPGGRLLVTDYCRGAGEVDEEFTKYVAQRGYHLLSPPDYGAILKKVGFHDVNAVDYTHKFVESLRKELLILEKLKDEFAKEDYESLHGGWTSKLRRCDAEFQKWGLFLATKKQ